MDFSFLTGDSAIFTWIILPLLIFLSRIADQSIGTLRLIFVSKGYKYIAPILGFFEVIIWLLAVTQIFKQLDNFYYYIAYGAGFAAGNYLGMVLEERISLGSVVVRIIPRKDTSKLVEAMKLKNYGITLMDAIGSRGPVQIIFTIIPRKLIKELAGLINEYNPNAFYSIEEVKNVSHGISQPPSPILKKPKMPQLWRRSK
ncbi:MAG: DUF2179 domain-containing protein [Bacteroidales bacterium]|nr:DUF2179 domain-containing protein [Bacteroidales bacterium]